MPQSSTRGSTRSAGALAGVSESASQWQFKPQWQVESPQFPHACVPSGRTSWSSAATSEQQERGCGEEQQDGVEAAASWSEVSWPAVAV